MDSLVFALLLPYLCKRDTLSVGLSSRQHYAMLFHVLPGFRSSYGPKHRMAGLLVEAACMARSCPPGVVLEFKCRGSVLQIRSIGKNNRNVFFVDGRAALKWSDKDLLDWFERHVLPNWNLVSFKCECRCPKHRGKWMPAVRGLGSRVERLLCVAC